MRRQGQPCEFSRSQSSTPWSTGWTKSTGTSVVYSPARICRCGYLPYPVRNTWGARPRRYSGIRQPRIQLRESHTIARGPGPPRKLGFCANQPVPCPNHADLSKARPINVRMGARYGVTPERPSWSQTFAEGQPAPGIRRVVPGNQLPKHLAGGTSAMPSTSGQKPRRRSRWVTPPGRAISVPHDPRAGPGLKPSWPL